MITKTQKRKIRQWSGCEMTMDTQGRVIHTMRTITVYWLWKIPIWKSTNYIDGTEQELEGLLK